MSKTGTVKFFNTDKGYGFIQPDDGSSDSFVHITAVQAAGMHSLDKDQRLNYELEKGRNGKESAVNGEFNGVPIEDKREVSSTMRMANGQTVFIGGLRKSSGSSSARKIPVLGDIPVVNLAFRSNSREERINELLVFVTCNVINEDVPLTDEQKKILNDSKLEEQKVDALETLWYDTKYPQTTKTPQIKWRRGS